MELLEIERELAGEGRMSAMERYDGVLRELAVRVGGALRAGLPPDEFGRCSELVEAVTVARKLLRLQVRKTEKTIS